MIKKLALLLALWPLSSSAQVVTPDPAAPNYIRATTRTDAITTGVADSGYVRNLRGYFLHGSKASGVMTANVTALRSVAGEGEDNGWADGRLPLRLAGDFYYVNDTVTWAARTGWPLIEGVGGELIYHPETQYGLGTFYTDESGSFNATTKVYTPSGSTDPDEGTDLDAVLVGAWVYGRVNGAGTPAWVSRVTAVDDVTTNTFTVQATPIYGTYGTLSGNATVHVYGSKGGPVTTLVWEGAATDKSIFDFYGHGGKIDGINFLGKQSTNGADLIVDNAGDPYPYQNPFETTRPNEDRCKYAIRVRSTSTDFGSGKHKFPNGFCAQLFQTAIEATHDSGITNHSDQTHLGPRVNCHFSDIGIHIAEQQAFSWTFNQFEAGFCRAAIVVTAGGKIVGDILDIQRECSYGLWIRGDNNSGVPAHHVSPACNTIRTVNFDETAPPDAQMVRHDPAAGFGYGNCKTHLGSDAIHNSFTRMKHGRAAPRYYETNANFVAATRTFTADTATNLSVITVGDLVRAWQDGDATTAVPRWVSRVKAVDDGANTFTVYGIPQSGAYANETNNLTVRIYNAAVATGVYEETNGSFVAATETFTADDAFDLSKIKAGDWVYAKQDATNNVNVLAWVSRVVSVNDGANTFVVTDATPYSGSAYANETNNLSVKVYSPADEKPLAFIRNSYGWHKFENGDNFFDRMVHVEGGVYTQGVNGHFPKIIIKNCEFASGEHNPLKPEDIFTTDSSGYVELIFESNFEQDASNDSNHGGKAYATYIKRGTLSGGVFTENETFP